MGNETSFIQRNRKNQRTILNDVYDPLRYAVGHCLKQPTGALKQGPPVVLGVEDNPLGGKGGDFNTVYKGAFSKIVLRKQNVSGILAAQTVQLEKIFSETGAQCWPPDEPRKGPCPVE